MVVESTSQSSTLELFERYATAAGAHVLVTADTGEIASTVAEIAGGTVRCSQGVLERYPGVCRAIQATGTNLTFAQDPTGDTHDRQTLAASLAGGTVVVSAMGGVAETGSLVLADDALSPRLLSMLADTCFVLVSAQDIVPDLDEAGEMLSQLQEQGHRYVSLVTGPSRTADIERRLTIGVQGPKALYIAVVLNVEAT